MTVPEISAISGAFFALYVDLMEDAASAYADLAMGYDDATDHEDLYCLAQQAALISTGIEAIHFPTA